MSVIGQPKSEGLRQLYWRDEILQLLFWIQGEGFGQRIEVETLERFLTLDAVSSTAHLERLAAQGLLERDDLGGYQLSDLGRSEGGRIFAAEFAHLTQPAHGACGPECWCRTSSAEAAACEEDRRSWAMNW
jgi:predicted transcriptional regulator of viral defense system